MFKVAVLAVILCVPKWSGDTDVLKFVFRKVGKTIYSLNFLYYPFSTTVMVGLLNTEKNAKTSLL